MSMIKPRFGGKILFSHFVYAIFVNFGEFFRTKLELQFENINFWPRGTTLYTFLVNLS